MKNGQMGEILKRAFEKLMPDLRHYYRMPVKGLVTKVYPGEYVADVQPLFPDERINDQETILKRVESPVAFASDNVKIFVTLSFWEGNPNQPYISQIRKFGTSSAMGGFQIGFKNVLLDINDAGNIQLTTSGDIRINSGGMTYIN